MKTEKLLTEQEHRQHIAGIVALIMTTKNIELQQRLWDKVDYHTNKIAFGPLRKED